MAPFSMVAWVTAGLGKNKEMGLVVSLLSFLSVPAMAHLPKPNPIPHP